MKLQQLLRYRKFICIKEYVEIETKVLFFLKYKNLPIGYRVILRELCLVRITMVYYFDSNISNKIVLL